MGFEGSVRVIERNSPIIEISQEEQFILIYQCINKLNKIIIEEPNDSYRTELCSLERLVRLWLKDLERKNSAEQG